MTKFNLYTELENLGFKKHVDNFGYDWLYKKLERDVDVVWHGTMKSEFQVWVLFSHDRQVARAEYYHGSGRRPFKVKDHLNQKRALNAIKQTAENNGFAL